MKSELQEHIGQIIVIDTNSSFLYIGCLIEAGEYFIILEEADVHDLKDSITTRDLYLIEALKHGVKVNRKRVRVVRDAIISLSLLSEIVKY